MGKYEELLRKKNDEMELLRSQLYFAERARDGHWKKLQQAIETGKDLQEAAERWMKQSIEDSNKLIEANKRIEELETTVRCFVIGPDLDD